MGALSIYVWPHLDTVLIENCPHEIPQLRACQNMLWVPQGQGHEPLFLAVYLATMPLATAGINGGLRGMFNRAHTKYTLKPPTHTR